MNTETTTTTTHTPGPWIYTKGLGGTKSHVHFYIGPDVRDAQGPETICPSVAGVASDSWIHAGNPNVLMSVAEAEANARLIAAAPDLLKTLQWIAETCDQVIDEPSQDINATELPYTDLIDMITAIRAEAFIAKTESGGAE